MGLEISVKMMFVASIKSAESAESPPVRWLPASVLLIKRIIHKIRIIFNLVYQ